MFIFAPVLAKAEYCNMVGMAREIKWIHIPHIQYEDNTNTTITVNGKEYKYNRSNKLFNEDNLPEVNSTATLNVDILSSDIPNCLTTKSCSASELKRWDKIQSGKDTIYNENKTAEIDISIYQGDPAEGGRLGNWDLNKGAKLKILSYQYINGVLFALVQILEC